MESEKDKTLNELITWIGSEEEQRLTQEAIKLAEKDAHIFLHVNNIDPKIEREPFTL